MNFIDEFLGGPAKTRLVKLFVFNNEETFSLKKLSHRTSLRTPAVKKEIRGLEKMKLVKSKVGRDEGRKTKLYFFNPNFPHFEALREFLLKVSPFTFEEIARRFQKAGRLKLLAVSGVFINDPESRVDMLVVGDKLKRKDVMKTISTIESELGRELRYTLLDSEDFEYRFGIGDKLVRDIFEFPHQVAFNKFEFIER